MAKLRLGIIGYGNMGTGHANRLKAGKVPNMELTAICDISEARRKAAKEKCPEVEVFETSQELFNNICIH